MMRIAHVCTNNGFIDGWGYQDNLLPQYIKELGVDNVVIAATKQPTTYLNGIVYPVGESVVEGIKVVRLKSLLLTNSLVVTFGLYKALKLYTPDVIMHHNLNFTSLVVSSIFCMLHRIPMVVDNHADSINSRSNKIYQLLYYRILIGGITKLFSFPIRKFYGVSLGRCDFLEHQFGISKKRVDFLPLGIDENTIANIENADFLRVKYGFDKDSIVIASGGKMGKDKGTADLIYAIENIRESNPCVKLLLFGSYNDKETEEMAKSKDFISVHGWCDRTKTLELLKLADLACWPIHHTTLCEDAIGCLTPLLLRKTRTTEHLIEGNGFFLETGNYDELIEKITFFIKLNKKERITIDSASRMMCQKLSYRTIAKKLIDDCKSFYNE